MPVGLHHMRIYGPVGSTIQCHVQIRNATEQSNAKTLAADLTLFDETGKIVAVVTGLLLQQINRQALQHLFQVNVDHWLYEVDWPVQSRDTSQGVSPDPGSWLIFADEGDTSKNLKARLEAKGEVCHCVYSGDGFMHKDANQWQVEPLQLENFHQLLTEINTNTDKPLRGVVHLWSLKDTLDDKTDLDTLHSVQARNYASVLHIVQALASQKGKMPQLALVTKGAQALPGDKSVNPASSTLWGLGNVIALEHPDLKCVRIDLDPTNADVSFLFDEIWASDKEDQVAFRGDSRHVARLVHSRMKPSENPARSSIANSDALKADATYLITGGLGGLGLVCADWMVEQGARHLALVSRKKPTKQVLETLNELEAQGVEIYVGQVDVSQREDVENLIHHIAENMPPLRGIIHAAGILDDGILLDQTWSRFSTVMAPKVDGAWNLHTLTSTSALDFFILFSANASLLGSPGQGNYASANAFLDGLAHYRRLQGLVALTIDWGAWAEVGMAAKLDAQKQRRWAMQGIVPIKPVDGMRAMARLLERGSVQVGVLPINWTKFDRHQDDAEVRPIFRLLAKGNTPEAKAGHSENPVSFLEQLKKTAPEDQFKFLIQYVQGDVNKVLGLDASHSFNLRQGFTDIGLDSLMAVELSNRLQKDLERSLPPTLTFEYPTLEALTNYLASEVLAITVPATRAESAQEIEKQKQALAAEIEEISEDKLEDALLNELKDAGY